MSAMKSAVEIYDRHVFEGLARNAKIKRRRLFDVRLNLLLAVQSSLFRDMSFL